MYINMWIYRRWRAHISHRTKHLSNLHIHTTKENETSMYAVCIPSRKKKKKKKNEFLKSQNENFHSSYAAPVFCYPREIIIKKKNKMSNKIWKTKKKTARIGWILNEKHYTICHKYFESSFQCNDITVLCERIVCMGERKYLYK